MNHTPYKYILLLSLTVIRKGLAECLINNYGLNQIETTEKLGISPAAVSQYLSGKRANMNVINKEMYNEINRSAERIIKLVDGILISETSRLCKIFTYKKLFPLGKRGGNCEIL